MLEIWMLKVDYYLLRLINVDFANPILDQVWLFLTQMHKNPLMQFVAFPAILLGLLYIYKTSVWKVLVMTGLAVAAADLLCYRVLKQVIKRARPFENPEISEWLRKVGEAHGSSFPSNHAANVFAGAIILAWFFPQRGKLFYTFAILVAVSRPALGVHYPSDVFAGAISGLFVGFLIRSLILNQTRYFHVSKSVSKVEDSSYTWRTKTKRLEDR